MAARQNATPPSAFRDDAKCIAAGRIFALESPQETKTTKPRLWLGIEAVPMSRFLYCIPLVLIASSALAQSAHEHDACARDVTRFCRAHMGEGDQMVLSCLQQNRQRLSRACDKVLTEHGQ
jgi:hypothetical protein